MTKFKSTKIKAINEFACLITCKNINKINNDLITI